MSKVHDVLVVGAGPAGYAIVGALAERGADVLWIAPDVNEPWPNSYGAWLSEIPSEFHSALAWQWTSPTVGFQSTLKVLDATYGRFENELLKGLLVNPEQKAKLRIEHRKAVDSDRSRARVVVDASGFQRVFCGGRSTDPAFQTAYGILAEVDGEPIDGHDMALMDYRPIPGIAEGPATFLYAMRLGGADNPNLWFLEETVLTARPALSISRLEELLYLRLESRGVRVLNVHEVERCVIPMGEEIPRGEALAFGAAAGFVHPATGYSLSRTLRSAGTLADAVVSASNNLSEVVWPKELRRARDFQNFGLDVLLGFDAAQTRRFFESFFELPTKKWQAYLSDQSGVGDIAATMWSQFLKVDSSLKWKLVQAGIGFMR